MAPQLNPLFPSSFSLGPPPYFPSSFPSPFELLPRSAPLFPLLLLFSFRTSPSALPLVSPPPSLLLPFSFRTSPSALPLDSPPPSLLLSNFSLVRPLVSPPPSLLLSNFSLGLPPSFSLTLSLSSFPFLSSLLMSTSPLSSFPTTPLYLSLPSSITCLPSFSSTPLSLSLPSPVSPLFPLPLPSLLSLFLSPLITGYGHTPNRPGHQHGTVVARTVGSVATLWYSNASCHSHSLENATHLAGTGMQVLIYVGQLYSQLVAV